MTCGRWVCATPTWFYYSSEYLAGYELRFYPVCPGRNRTGIFRVRSVVFADASDSGTGSSAAVVPDCPRQEEIKNLLFGNDDCCGNGGRSRSLRFGAAWRFSPSRLCGVSSRIILAVRQIRYFSVFRSSFVNRWISFSRAWRIFPPIPHPPAGRGLRQSGQIPLLSAVPPEVPHWRPPLPAPRQRHS